MSCEKWLMGLKIKNALTSKCYAKICALQNKNKQATKTARKQNLSSSLMCSHNSIVTALRSCWFALVLLWPWGIFKTQQQCCNVQQLSSSRVDFWTLLSRANDLQSSSHFPAPEELSCCGSHEDEQASKRWHLHGVWEKMHGHGHTLSSPVNA